MHSHWLIGFAHCVQLHGPLVVDRHTLERVVKTAATATATATATLRGAGHRVVVLEVTVAGGPMGFTPGEGQRSSPMMGDLLREWCPEDFSVTETRAERSAAGAVHRQGGLPRGQGVRLGALRHVGTKKASVVSGR